MRIDDNPRLPAIAPSRFLRYLFHFLLFLFYSLLLLLLLLLLLPLLLLLFYLRPMGTTAEGQRKEASAVPPSAKQESSAVLR